MTSKLPVWVWVGGFLLALAAGITNAVGLLAIEHQALSHLTGTTTQLAVSLHHGDMTLLLRLAGVVTAFVFGAVISGSLIQDSVLRLRRGYGTALLLESMLLCAATLLLERNYQAGIYCASCACGLQNALATTYSGAIIRTTHMTGIFTDLGILVGHRLRGMPFDTKRAGLLSMLVLGFLSGSFIGAGAFDRGRFLALLLPAALTGAAGLSYLLWHRLRRYLAMAGVNPSE